MWTPTAWPIVRLLLAATIAAGQLTPTTTEPPAAEGEDDDFYSVGEAKCDLRRPYLRRLNGLTIERSTVGAVGAILCLLAVMHIYGYGLSKRSLATRLTLGMLVSNFVVAVCDIVPTHLFRLSGELCGFFVIGPRNTETATNCLPAAVGFLGVWSTTMYELMMVWVSIHALRTGKGSIPATRERALHLLCVGAGVAALLGYFSRCQDLGDDVASLEAEVYAAEGRHGNFSTAQKTRHDQLFEAYEALPAQLWGWALGPVVLAFLSWIFQRLLHHEMVQGWEDAKARHRAFEQTDALAAIGLDPSSDTGAKLLELIKLAYDEVVQPLELFVVVIFLFTVPQIIGVTPGCKGQTQATFDQGYAGNADAPLPCEWVVALVMAFRAPVLAAAYLLPDPKVRAEAFDIPTLCRKVWGKVAGRCGCGRRTAASGGVRFPSNEIDGIALVEAEGEGRSASFGKADHDVKRMGFMASRNLAKLDFPDAATAEEEAEEHAGDAGPSDPADSQIPYQRMD